MPPPTVNRDALIPAQPLERLDVGLPNLSDRNRAAITPDAERSFVRNYILLLDSPDGARELGLRFVEKERFGKEVDGFLRAAEEKDNPVGVTQYQSNDPKLPSQFSFNIPQGDEFSYNYHRLAGSNSVFSMPSDAKVTTDEAKTIKHGFLEIKIEQDPDNQGMMKVTIKPGKGFQGTCSIETEKGRTTLNVGNETDNLHLTRFRFDTESMKKNAGNVTVPEPDKTKDKVLSSDNATLKVKADSDASLEIHRDGKWLTTINPGNVGNSNGLLVMRLGDQAMIKAMFSDPTLRLGDYTVFVGEGDKRERLADFRIP